MDIEKPIVEPSEPWTEIDTSTIYRNLNNEFLDWMIWPRIDGTLLDIGSGTGLLVQLLNERGRLPRNALAIEPDQALRETARKCLPASVRVLDGTMENFHESFPPRSAGTILFGNCLHLAQSPAATLARAADTLMPGGTLGLISGYADESVPSETRSVYLSLIFNAYRRLRRAGLVATFERGAGPSNFGEISESSITASLQCGRIKTLRSQYIEASFDLKMAQQTVSSTMFAKSVFPKVDPQVAGRALRDAMTDTFPEDGLKRRYLLVQATTDLSCD